MLYSEPQKSLGKVIQRTSLIVTFFHHHSSFSYNLIYNLMLLRRPPNYYCILSNNKRIQPLEKKEDRYPVERELDG
jgi:hypothetical protein